METAQEPEPAEAKPVELDTKDALKAGTAAQKVFDFLKPLGAVSGALGSVAGVLGIQKGVKQADEAKTGKDEREGELNVAKGVNDVAKGGVSVAKSLAEGAQVAEAGKLSSVAEVALQGGATVEGAATAAGAPAAAIAKTATAGNTAAAQGAVLGNEAAAASTVGQNAKLVSNIGKGLGVAGGALDAGVGLNKILSDGATSDQKIDGASDIANGALTAATTLAAGPVAPLVLAANKLLTPLADDYSKKNELFHDDKGKAISASEAAARDGADAKAFAERNLSKVGIDGTVANVIGTGVGGLAKLGMGVGNNVVTGVHALGSGISGAASAVSGAASRAASAVSGAASRVWSAIPSIF